MIGRMHRPLKILNIPGKRGFHILNKYKSNFGGILKFDTDVYLNYDADNQTEVVQIEFDNIEIPLYIKKGSPIENGKVISKLKERKIKSFRKLVRPTKISSKDVLEFVMEIESKNKKENDILEIRLSPILVNTEEYLYVEVECETPVIISSSTTLRLAE